MSDPLSYLFGLEQFGMKFGLENIRALTAALGHSERTFATVHVAGTNGKGSVTAMVDAALGAAAYRSGRYTSPHLVDVTERFVVNGRPAPVDELCGAIDRVRAAVESLLAAGALAAQPTFFEVATAAAFELFRRAGVEIAVLEVGLGGRLDATNVVEPAVTAVTTIDFDHQRYLGRTLAEIASEKAGIVKPGVPVVVGRLPDAAAGAVEAAARGRGAPLVRAWDGTTVRVLGADSADELETRSPTRFRLRTTACDYGEVDLALAGACQIDNAVVAVRVLEQLGARGFPVSPGAVREGLARVSWPGRLDTRRLADGREVLLDAAHNAAGAAALASYLRRGGRTARPLVFSAMRDKDARAMLTALTPVVASLVVTRASNARAADPDALAALAKAIAPALPVAVEPVPREALAAAWRAAPAIVVAGSIFLLGDVLQEIGRS